MSGLVLDVPRELLVRHAMAAPRYTSYPTAVDWRNNVAAGTYGERLGRSAEKGDPCAVYVHIPFCAERCLFCGCNVFITHDSTRADTYLDRLEREIATVHAAQGRRRRVTQYHWGGGTPTYLDERQIERLQGAFLGAFELEAGAEVAIEVDPRVTSAGQLKLLGKLGFNRLSLGIQDFDPKVQEAMKRVQSVEETRAVVQEGRAQGFASVSVDLIYGLPYQTLDGFLRTVELVLELRPERVALFHYAHVPWLKKHQTALDLDAAPPAELKMTIFTRAVAAFTGAGYEYLGLDHFALPDDELARARRDRTLKRNFMGYSTRAGFDLIGLGVSAIGEVDGAFFQNEPVLGAWQDQVLAQGTATGRNHDPDDDDRLRRRIIMELMCLGEIKKAEITGILSVDFDRAFARELADLEPLRADGLIVWDADVLRVTPLGQVFLRNIAVVFDRYFRDRNAGTAGPSNTFSRTV